MPLHVHREICFSRVQVKQSQTPEMFETLYSRGVVQWFDNYSAFTGSHFSFDMGIDFLLNFFLQVKETGDPAEQKNQSQSW